MRFSMRKISFIDTNSSFDRANLISIFCFFQFQMMIFFQVDSGYKTNLLSLEIISTLHALCVQKSFIHVVKSSEIK